MARVFVPASWYAAKPWGTVGAVLAAARDRLIAVRVDQVKVTDAGVEMVTFAEVDRLVAALRLREGKAA